MWKWFPMSLISLLWLHDPKLHKIVDIQDNSRQSSVWKWSQTDGLLGQLTLGPGTANYVNNSAYREDESDNSIILSLGSPLAPWSLLVSPGLPWSPLVPAPVASE